MAVAFALAAAAACRASETPTGDHAIYRRNPPLPRVADARWGWLHPDPVNPHYLATGGGPDERPFLIASYGTLVPCTFVGDEARRLKAAGASYAVIWQPWSGCGGGEPAWTEQPWIGPWAVACDPLDPVRNGRCPEHPVFDLDRFDERYWSRLDEVLEAAERIDDRTGQRLVVRVNLFARQDFDSGGRMNPLKEDNNVNGVRCYEGNPVADPALRYFVRATWLCAAASSCDAAARAVFDRQKAYVSKLLDATRRHENVVYEVMNEPPSALNPGGEMAAAFAYFTDYWSWFVKSTLADGYGVSRVVAADARNDAELAANVDVVDARWGDHDPAIPEDEFLENVLAPLSAAVRGSARDTGKVTSLDEFGNAESDALRLRRAVWAIVTSGGHVHLEDPCDPGARPCPGEDGEPDARVNARPWEPVRSIAAFARNTGWRFDRAAPAYRDEPASRFFYWMLQGTAADAVGFAAAGVQDHVGYLAVPPAGTCKGLPLHSDLPPLPPGAPEYTARLWDPAGTDYLRDRAGEPIEHRFAWGGGPIDWCSTPLRDALLSVDDVVIHVRARREAPRHPAGGRILRRLDGN